MKPPKSLTVGPYTYTVRIGGKAFDQARLAEGDRYLLGHCDHKSLTIAIAGGLADDALREVLLHEAMHASLNAAGQPLDDMDGSDHEENAVRVLAPTVLATLRANPALLAFLTA